MKLYVYCLARGIDESAGILHGIGGVAVRQFQIGNLSALVSDFTGDAVAVNRENAVAHAAVIQNVLKQTTPLPFRFGTLVTEQQLESLVSARREAVEATLELVHGCVEMNVKIISDPEAAETPEPGYEPEKPGTAFLSEKRREILGSEARAEEAKRVAAWLETRIGEVVKETRIHTNQTAKLLLAVAHLVPRAAVDQYRSRLTEARHERPELHFLMSGPWAPYSFANIDLEFKTHFGVS